MHKIFRIFLPALALLLPSATFAQYSEAAFELKKLQDSYDERGLQGSAISVDGKLAVNNQSGGVTWSYPIASFMSGGHQVTSSLNYCGSVQFSAYADYNLADRQTGALYGGWKKFETNKPVWVLGVNGWAVNVIAVTPHYKPQPDSRVYDNFSEQYDDRDLLWTIDGYDVCNRMRDFGALAQGEPYRDVIKILRADGSVMELLNVTTRSEINNQNPDTVDLPYIGTYFVNEANSRGYGVVEYATHLLPLPINDYIDDAVPPRLRHPVYPRILKFYPGDGTEVLFEERVAPFGFSAYQDDENRSGGIWGGHPTIFYLSRISGNNGIIVDFHRSRHYPNIGGPLNQVPDLTRGRALITSFTNHEIRFGYNSIIVEALGRTHKIRFDTISRCGNAGANEVMPFANLGAMSPMVEDYVGYSEESAQPYRGFLGYVTKIIDPEDRVTEFRYEKNTRQYTGFGFPHTSGSTTLTLKNYRLTEVREPAARYTLKYYGSLSESIQQGEDDPKKLNNMVDSVRKYGPDGTLLTTDLYAFHDEDNLGNASFAEQITTDHITGHSRRTEFRYENFGLNSYIPILSPSRKTVLKSTTEFAGDVRTETITTYATATQVPTWKGHGNFTVLPVAQTVSINGITKSHQEFSYELDTLRKVWRNPDDAGKYGMEVTKKITKTIHPADPARVLLIDTTTYLHLPALDTTVTWMQASWDKFKTLANFFYLRDTLQDPAVVGKRWEEVSLRPPVAVIDVDEVTEEVRVPPIFGLEERSWTTDTAGAVTGKRNVYLTNILEGSQKSLRGKLVADSILGSNNKRLLNGAYSYTRGWTGDLLASKKNALGIETLYSYGYSFCNDVPYWEECDDIDPVGKIIANDGTTRSYELQWNPFSYWFAKPVGERQYVRRYDAFGNLRVDTLTNYTERTFHGQASATMDPNDYVSRFDYDYNGRLNAGWLPFDYAGTGVLDTFTYEGPEHVDLYGTTHHHRKTDTLHCWEGWDGQNSFIASEILPGPVLHTVNHDTLYASLPITRVPECPPLSNGAGNREKDEDRNLQRFYENRYPYHEYSGYQGLFGMLGLAINAENPLKRATRIDSLSLDLMITSISGTCVHLEVKIDSIFTKTFVLNCESSQGGGGDDDPPNNETKRQGRSLQGLTPVAGGYKLRVDLNTVAAQLRNRPNGSLTNIQLRMKTAGGVVAFINGTNAEDLRPRLNIYGEYDQVWDRADYTVAYDHNDNNLTTTVKAKVDDSRHTGNDLASQGISVRRTEVKNIFGADYRVLRSERTVVEPDTTRIDIARQIHTGLGAKMRTIDAEGDSTSIRYDAANRPIRTINADGTVSAITYIHARPDSLGIIDQDFYGYCDVKITTNENGVKFAQFSDALGRIRREISDYGDSLDNLNLTVKYEYNLLGRLVQVTDPKGQVTTYTHDELGRVLTKTHPDLGTTAYAYDNLGNARFSQSSEQAAKNLLTYRQYDDLNRLTLIGESYIDEEGICQAYNEDDLNGSSGCGDGSYLTHRLNGNKLHVAGGSLLTANKKMFMSPSWGTTTFTPLENFELRNCQLDPEPRLGETERPPLPLIMHPTTMYKPRNGGYYGAPLEEFEDIALYPEFGRIAIQYDAMPSRSGAIWEGFPAPERWDALAPTGKVRNQKGREAAVAYRDKSAEPYHFSVLSYDERGRVEALIRFNENLGFDGVYYQYNSANQVIAVTVADPWRKFETYYGYDHQGRVDSVWTKMYPVGSGLISDGTFNNLRFPGFGDRQGLSADIVYSYTKTDRVRSMEYPTVGALVEYAYNSRKFLDSLVAARGDITIFKQRLSYDSTGQIMAQEYQHGASAPKLQEYEYDPVQRLTSWSVDGINEEYLYDEVGNRQNVTRSTQPTENYWYQPGTNRLWSRDQPDLFGNDSTYGYGYNRNGALTSNILTYNTPHQSRILRREEFDYSFRGLMNRARVQDIVAGVPKPSEDWRYRYNPMGEREQKRLYPSQGSIVPAPDSTVYPWRYYLLSGDKKQLAVYNGQQMDSMAMRCGDVGKNRVYMYPHEYLTYGSSDVALVVTRPTGNVEYKIVDHLGSTRAVIDGGGNVAGTYDNTPFGEQLAVTGMESRKQYIDKEVDRETSSGNYGVRHYDPEIGKFWSTDALWENHRGQSPYHYALNNPLRYIDATGLDTTGSKDPGQSRGWQIAEGIACIVGGSIATVGGIALCVTGIGSPVGAGVATALGIPTIGAGIAILADVATKEPDEELAEIPTGVGDAIGFAFKEQYGWTYAPLICGGLESYATGGFNAVNMAKGFLKLDGPLRLFGFGYTSISTGMSMAETAYDAQHPATETSASPRKVLKGSGPQNGIHGGVAPMLMNGPD